MIKFLKLILYIIGCFFIVYTLAQKSGIQFLKKANAFEWQKKVNIYFPYDTANNKCEIKDVYPIVRKIPNSENLGLGALEYLLKGPSLLESNIKSYLNKEILIQKFELKNQNIYIDFSSSFNDILMDECVSKMARKQIEKTLKSVLNNVDDIYISVDGEVVE